VGKGWLTLNKECWQFTAFQVDGL